MPHPDIATAADIARVYGAERPETVALVAGDRTLTFADLDARSSRAAQAFRAAGVGFGDRVAFIEKNGIEFFEVVCALSKLGAIVVPVNWRLAPAEMAHIIDDADARVVVVGDEFFGHVEAIEDRLAASVVAIGEHPRWPAFDAWLADHPADDPCVTTQPDDVAFLMYTSGTTGAPKGVMLTNDNYFCKATGIAEKWRFDADSVSLAVMPMFHMAGSGWALVGLCEGARTVVLRDVDPPAILEAVAQHGITNMLLVPVVIQRLLETAGVETTDFASLRAIVYGASPITDDVLVKALERFDCDLLQVYGQTETTGSITQLDRHDPELLRSCGKPFEWVEVRIVDDAGRDVPTGTVGELWTRSRQNMRGYWNNPDATAATLTDDGWLKTGDAGYLDEEGYVFLHDRVKDMIVSGGENVYPAEVENVLMTHPAVGDVAVIGVPDMTWGEAVKAIVVPVSVGCPSESELIAYARDRLAGFKLPKSVSFAEDLPRTPSGKVLKRALREPYWEGVGRRIG
ncbi:long-chain-fatty-acid--CoA ligase [Mycolicibacterium celeriflavum]|uniref:Long-chain-fatty-acid--CoA ligase FadD13 n=1 Tax=Mycolicibacterium celeriflavum TaxID=1249101 RepID=A0A1X0BU05_MYCCF|nr:long-chain-fatty-acid--CoA ligase [Mycolicibacterium celeriflavum]MCV7239823.1 long-chain-fatty-acid--CoA ligase [Mycolicibacterium celeriflavum]ORA47164.1 long-chain fatty acid--CoA ligase [Mycolicibacterium celeriflavum]BBY44334.1 acyl-CoA synthetase [Mycolicibacterium celeriflavum]